MRRDVLVPTLAVSILGLALLAVGIVYLTVECQALPGFLGPTHGDTAPRTPLGIVGVVLGAAVLIAALFISRRQPPRAPRQP
jgi:hypothetical protein